MTSIWVMPFRIIVRAWVKQWYLNRVRPKKVRLRPIKRHVGQGKVR